MKLIFLGTRGNIDVRNRRHWRHTTTLVSYRGKDVLIDCGDDWLGELEVLRPHAIVLTHAHPDHVGGLKRGAPCPVYAPRRVLDALRHGALRETHTLMPRSPMTIGGIRFEAFPVMHSLRAPAVGYRLSCGFATVFYVPDVLAIPNRREALGGIRVYIGDGATIRRPIVRMSGARPTGHASVSTQLDWCAHEAVPRTIFTHCGTAIVSGGVRAEQEVLRLANAKDIDGQVAYDGLQIVVR